MFDVIVNGTAEGWVDDGSFPVAVKVALSDAHGRVHHIVEKFNPRVVVLIGMAQMPVCAGCEDQIAPPIRRPDLLPRLSVG